MTGRQFAAEHGDPADWTPADYDTCQNLALADRSPAACWFCGTDGNPPNYTVCGYCRHHAADGPAA